MDLVDRVLVLEEPLRVEHRWIRIGLDLRTMASAACLALVLVVMGSVSAKLWRPEQPRAVAIACDHALGRCVISSEGRTPSEVETKGLRARSDRDRNGKNSPSSWNLELARGHTTLVTVRDYRSEGDPYRGEVERLNAFLKDTSAPSMRIEIIERPPEAILSFLYGGCTALPVGAIGLMLLLRGHRYTFRAAERDITRRFGRRQLPVARWEEICAVRVVERADGTVSMALERAKGPPLALVERSGRREELRKAAEVVAGVLGLEVTSG